MFNYAYVRDVSTLGLVSLFNALSYMEDERSKVHMLGR